jgi:hypothetical protein
MRNRIVVRGFWMVALLAVGGFATALAAGAQTTPQPPPAALLPAPSAPAELSQPPAPRLTPAAPQPATALQPDGPDAVCVDPSEGVGAQALGPGAEAAACSRCPDGSPQCWGDKQCDSVCGGKGTGDCVRINSCYKCCYCALTS